jgi:membrane protein required for colicin V production
MTVLDYFVLIVVVASVAIGAARGAIKGIISIASALAGLALAAQLYPYAAGLFGGLVSTARAANFIGFVAIFLFVMAAGSLLARWLRGGLKRARLDWLDHLLGAGLGLLRGWLICSVIYLALTAFPVKLEAVERATFAPALLEGTRVIAYMTSSDLRERFFNGYAMIQGMWGQKS